jgi:O-antigen/teichoic acid export membrane protein
MTASGSRIRTDLGADPRAMARGAAINLLGAFGANGLGLVVTLVITHMVSASAIGLVAVGMAIVSFSTIVAIFGLDTGVIRFVALGASIGDERAARAALQVSMTFVTVGSAVLTAAIWWQAPWLAEQVFHKPQVTDIIRILSLSLWPLALTRVIMAGVQGYGIMEYSAVLGILRRIFEFAAVVPLLALGLGATGLAISAVITAEACAVVSMLFLLRVRPMAFEPALRSWPVLRLLNFSGPQVLSATLFFGMVWTSTILLARFGTARDVGIYAVLGSLMIPAGVVSIAIGQMFAPRVAAEDARGDRRKLAEMLKRVTHWNTAVSIPFFAALAVIPEPLLRLFGPAYADGATALTLLAIGQLVNTAAGPLGQVINLSGRQYLSAANNVLAVGLNLAVALVLIPRYGMAGAAASTAAALVLLNVLRLVEVRIIFGCHPFRGDTVRTILAGGIAAAVAGLASVFVSGAAPLFEALTVGTLLFATYVAAIWALGVSDEDRELFRRGRARIARGLGFDARPLKGLQ